MDQRGKDLLYQLLMTPAPSGSEGQIQQVVHDNWAGAADRVETDLHGNLILGLNTDAPRRVMLAGHCDQIGFMVVKIDPSGFLLVEPVGGIDASVVSGSRVVVHTSGGPIEGVFGKAPIHLQSQQQSKSVPSTGSMWIDVGAADRADAERHVRPGDYVTFKPGVVELMNDRVTAPGLDNRAGLFVVLEAFRRCADADLDVALFAVSTVQEEVGSRGAGTATAALRPEIGIAVDVTFAFDDPATSSQTKAGCTIGGGPCISHGPNTNIVVERGLKAAADRAGVRYQPSPTGALEGNDAKAVQEAVCGAATAAIGIPNRNMHTAAEVCSLADIEGAVEVLAGFITNITPDTDFRPFQPGNAAQVNGRR
ncbi:M20/M25/M40 family metallo-hydrolase [Gemmata sp.]|uniref:M20/M25/M40 family metallo-hydrolase n=1 Tax=Gemmata sp. TaxID=1914242 RepID=UPI003F6E6E06